ncbi:MAG: hypothetical protein R6V47_03420 [Candidatus Delongbacteria bacterium]
MSRSKKKKLRKILKKKDNTVIIDRVELIKQLRRTNFRKSKIIEPKKRYNRKDKSWKKDIE